MSQTNDEYRVNEAVESEENLSEILQVRREKLFKLQKEGKNPYEITRYHPTHYSSQILDEFDTLEGQEVNLAGRIMS